MGTGINSLMLVLVLLSSSDIHVAGFFPSTVLLLVLHGTCPLPVEVP